MTRRRLALACGLAASLLTLAGCATSSAGDATGTAPSTYSGPSVPSIEPDLTPSDGASVEAIGAFVLRHLTFHDKWSGGTGPTVTDAQVAASTAQAWKAFATTTTFSVAEFTSLFERIAPFYQTGFTPVLIDRERAAKADTTRDNTAVQYFLEGTDGNYVITMSMTHSSGSWQVVRFEPESTSARDAAEVEDPPATASSSAPSGPGPAQDGAVTVMTSTGKTVEIDVAVHTVQRGSDASSAWQSVGGKDDIPCLADPQTDAVVVGTMSLVNTTPDYPTSIYVNYKSAVTGGDVEVGVSYSDGNTCVTRGSDGWEGSAIQPNWKSATWGPVPIAFVVHQYFGPSVAADDTSRLPAITTLFGSTANEYYTVESATGLFSLVSGTGASLDLANLH